MWVWGGKRKREGCHIRGGSTHRGEMNDRDQSEFTNGRGILLSHIPNFMRPLE